MLRLPQSNKTGFDVNAIPHDALALALCTLCTLTKKKSKKMANDRYFENNRLKS